MNTARSVWLGWTTLMVAGAGAYYFAKKDINSYRREQELKGIRGTEYLECTFPFPPLPSFSDVLVLVVAILAFPSFLVC